MLLLQNIERLLLASKLLLIYSTRIGLCFKLSSKAGHVLNKTGKGPILRWRWSRGNIHWCKSLGGFDVSGSQIFIDASQRGSFSDQPIVRSCYGSCGNYDNGFHSFHFILQQFLPLWFKHRRKKSRLFTSWLIFCRSINSNSKQNGKWCQSSSSCDKCKPNAPGKIFPEMQICIKGRAGNVVTDRICTHYY